MSIDLYQKCELCGGTGELKDPRSATFPTCPSCGGTKFWKIGLTSGQVERMARLEVATARAYLGDSGIDGPGRYTVRYPDREVARFMDLDAALAAFRAHAGPMVR